MKNVVNTNAASTACLVASFVCGLTLGLQADQLPNPSVTASARPYNASYTAANLFDALDAEYATLGQAAVSVPFTTDIMDGTWVEMDFGATVEFDRFVMRARNNAVDVVGQSRLIVSDDPAFDDSDRIFTFDPSGSNGAGIIQRFPSAVSGRYVRWEVLSGGGLNLGANQMWFLKTPEGQSLMAPPVVINTSTPFNASYVGANAFDGNFGTDYASQGAQSSVFMDFDFGDTKPISGFEFLNRWSDRITTFDLIFSDVPDFSEELDRQSFTADPSGNWVNSVTFEPVSARYIRLQATGFEGAVNTGAREIQFYTPAGQPPTFAQIPSGGTRYAGDNFTMHASALGDLPLSFQWYLGGVAITDATNSTLALTNMQADASGEYTVKVTNPSGSVTSDPPAVLTVLDPDLDIDSELRLWLKFDETFGIYPADDSGYGRNVVLTGFVDDDSQWVAGRMEGALRVNPDGSVTGDDAVLVTDDGGLDFSTSMEFTLSAWVNGNPTQEPGAGIIAKGNGAGGEQFSLDVETGKYRFYVRNDVAAATVFQSSVAPNNTWQHLVAVFSVPLQRVKLYVNGIEVLSGTPPATLLQNSHEVTIGSRQSGSDVYNMNFDGLMDDVRIYGRALTAADVTELYNQASLVPPSIITEPTGGNFLVFDTATLSVVADGSVPLSYQWLKDDAPIAGATKAVLQLTNLTTNNNGSYVVRVTNARGTADSAPAIISVDDPAPDLNDGLMVHLKLDETSGTEALDSSGFDRNGAMQGFAEEPWTAGILGGALAFNPDGDAGDDAVLVPDDGSLDFSASREFSLTAWVNAGPLQESGAGIIAKGNGNGGETFALDVYNGNYRFYGWSGPGTPEVYNSPIGPNNTWQHIAAVCSVSLQRVRFYVNGVQVLSALPPSALVQNNHELTIGSRQAASGAYDLNFIGMIDDVRVYSRPLSPREVRSLSEFGSHPQLTIKRSGGSVIISWPTSVASFVLESSGSLTGGAWTPVAGVANNSVTLSAEGAGKFFRLSKAE